MYSGIHVYVLYPYINFPLKLKVILQRLHKCVFINE